MNVTKTRIEIEFEETKKARGFDVAQVKQQGITDSRGILQVLAVHDLNSAVAAHLNACHWLLDNSGKMAVIHTLLEAASTMAQKSTLPVEYKAQVINLFNEFDSARKS